jgi:hypothetical protein
MSPVVPDRRFDAAVPGPRRATIISGPMGGRRCIRYGTLLKRGPRVRSSWSRSGSSSGTPGPGVARELPFKSHFKGEAKQSAACLFLGGLYYPIPWGARWVGTPSRSQVPSNNVIKRAPCNSAGSSVGRSLAPPRATPQLGGAAVSCQYISLAPLYPPCASPAFD